MLYRIDNWFSESSRSIIDSIESQYIVSTFRQLIGSCYIKLPAELKSPEKGLIIIKSNDQKCFLVILGILIQQKYIQKELRKKIKNLLTILIMMELNFLCQKKKNVRIETKNNIPINAFCYENKLTFPIYNLNQKVKSSIDLLLIAD